MPYSTITTCRMCSYSTTERGLHTYCGKGLEPNRDGCSGYQQGIQARPSYLLPLWDNPYPIHSSQRYRVRGCMILPTDGNNTPFTNYMSVDRHHATSTTHSVHHATSTTHSVHHATSHNLLIDILNILAEHPKVAKALMDCRFDSAYGIPYKDYMNCAAEVSISICMLWGVHKVQVYVQSLVFPIGDAKKHRPPYLEEGRDSSNINEVPEQYWWLDIELPPNTLRPMHALLAVLIKILEKYYSVDSYTYMVEAVGILTNALNVGLMLRNQPLIQWTESVTELSNTLSCDQDLVHLWSSLVGNTGGLG